MSATTAAAAAAVSVMIASTCRLIAIAIVAVARAALVMMVMVALLLALQAYVRDDHLRVVAHAVVIAAASAKEYININQICSVSFSLSLSLSLSLSPVQILTGALHIVAQIVAGARHAGRIQRFLAAQSVVRAVLRGGFMQILPRLAVVSEKGKATSFCHSHNSP